MSGNDTDVARMQAEARTCARSEASASRSPSPHARSHLRSAEPRRRLPVKVRGISARVHNPRRALRGVAQLAPADVARISKQLRQLHMRPAEQQQHDARRAAQARGRAADAAGNQAGAAELRDLAWRDALVAEVAAASTGMQAGAGQHAGCVAVPTAASEQRSQPVSANVKTGVGRASAIMATPLATGRAACLQASAQVLQTLE